MSKRKSKSNTYTAYSASCWIVGQCPIILGTHWSDLLGGVGATQRTLAWRGADRHATSSSSYGDGRHALRAPSAAASSPVPPRPRRLSRRSPALRRRRPRSQ